MRVKTEKKRSSLTEIKKTINQFRKLAARFAICIDIIPIRTGATDEKKTTPVNLLRYIG